MAGNLGIRNFRAFTSIMVLLYHLIRDSYCSVG